MFYISASVIVCAGPVRPHVKDMVPVEKRVIGFCAMLLTFGCLTITQSYLKFSTREKNFEKFYRFASASIKKNDILVFPYTSIHTDHLVGITSYLFPGHTTVFNTNHAFWNKRPDYHGETLDSLFAETDLFDQPAWIICDARGDESKNYTRLETSKKPLSSGSLFLINGEASRYGWDYPSNAYNFVMYRTESLRDCITQGNFLWKRTL
jgi:hypothetical protein